MTPHEWIKDTLNRWPAGHHVAEGATHLAAALEEIATMSPACARCQSAHCCSVASDSAKIPLCVMDPDGSLPLWMPWTNADVQARVDPLHAEIDRLRAEAGRVEVPEFDANDALHFGQSFDEAGTLGKQAEFLRGWLAAEFRAHSVPSSRVLKDGEAAVTLDLVALAAKALEACNYPADNPVRSRLDALRTQATESGENGGA